MSVDIVAGVTVPVLLQQCERLAAPHRATSGGFQYASTLDNSVAVISALSADLLASDTRVSELQAENEKLKGALERNRSLVAKVMTALMATKSRDDLLLAGEVHEADHEARRALAKDHPNAEG